MQTGKIYFIHLRDVNKQTGEYVQNGGATIAWMVEEETGNLLLGQPARCRSNEKFVKEKGREVATDNILSLDPLEYYLHSEVASIALSGGISALNVSALTPSARVILMAKLAEILEASAPETMSTQWYESFIRSRVAMVKGRLVYNFEQGDALDFAAIQQSDRLFSDLMTATLQSYGAIIEA